MKNIIRTVFGLLIILTLMGATTNETLLKQARQLNKTATDYYQQGNAVEALKHFQQLLPIAEKMLGKAHPDTAAVYSDMGEVYRMMGQYDQALSYAQQAFAIRKNALGEEHASTAVSYNNMALAYGELGDHPKALEYAQRALTIRKNVFADDHLAIATSYNNIGIAYDDMNNYAKGLEYKKKALAIKEKQLGKQHLDTALSYNNIGMSYSAMKQYPKALEYHQKSLAIQQKQLSKDHPHIAVSYNNIGTLYLDMGHYRQALIYQKKALALRKTILGEDHPHIASSHNNIGDTYAALGDYAQALEYQQHALTMAKKVLGKQHPNTATSLHNISRTYQAMGNMTNAYDYAKQAFTLFIRHRDNHFSALDAQQKKHYLKANNDRINDFFLVSFQYLQRLIKDKQFKLAGEVGKGIFNDWLMYKGSILDSENRLLSFAQTSTDAAIQQHYQALIQRKIAYAKLAQSQSSKPEQREIQLKKQAEAIRQLQYAIAQKDPRFKQETALNVVTGKGIKQQLSPQTLYLDYGKIQGHYIILTLGATDGRVDLLTKEESKKIDQGIAAFRQQINDIIDDETLPEEMNDASQKILAELYTLIFPLEIQQYLNDKSQLIISPDSALRLLPFEALYDATAQQYLVQQKDIHYIASGRELMRVFKRQGKQTAVKARRAVLFSHPDFGQNDAKPATQRAVNNIMHNAQSLTQIRNSFRNAVDELPGTAKEAQQIQRSLVGVDIESLNRKQANEQNLLKTRQTDILHIATHGFFNADSPNPMLQSGILLAGANHSIKNKTDTGIVNALKLSGLALEGTDLVVLSACETGTVDPNSTEGVSGLTKAFIQAGAQKVVMSLWAVADQETADLMADFYNNSKGQANVYAKALRQSKIKMIEEGLHPYYWAAFILNGL